MASSLFGATSQNSTPLPQNPPQPVGSNQPSDPVDIVTRALAQSGGDAKSAFYSLAEQKGVDPQKVLDQINSMGDPKKLMQNMLMSNPRIGGLFRLFGSMK